MVIQIGLETGMYVSTYSALFRFGKLHSLPVFVYISFCFVSVNFVTFRFGKFRSVSVYFILQVPIQDSSAVRWLFVRLAGAVGRGSVLHKENSGFVAPTLGRHISMFRGYRILFSIRNPYLNRFTNHFSTHS